MSPIDRLWNYWNIQKPVRLVHQDSFNGECITPLHTEKKVLMPKYDDEFVSITPIHEENKGSIQRTFGDLLAEEVIA